jgi:hypothetical protein
MNFISTFFSILFICFTIGLNAQDSPVVSMGIVTTTASTVVVPVKVVKFTDIKACDLKILYNPSIVKPTVITKGIGLGGSANVNISTPGEIVIGWYSGFPVSMTDNSAIFNISFDKVSNGTSILDFDLIANNDCQFYNGSGVKLNDVPSSTFYFPGSLNMVNESPVTTAPNLKPSLNEIINVPVTVTGFNKIGAVSLMLNYDPLVLNYNSADNTGSFPGLIIYNPIPGKITVSGNNANLAGYSLADNSVFFTLNFTYLGGTSLLSWIDDGESCEYAGPGPDYFILNDIPQENFFINGSVGLDQLIPTIAIGTITSPTTCGGKGNIPLVFTNVPDGNYIIDYDGGSFASIDVLANAALIVAPAGTYNDLQITVNSKTSVLGVNIVLTDPASPDQPVITAGGPTSFCEGGNVVLTSGEALTYLWSTGETTQSITAYTSGNYSVTVSNASGCSATSEILVVTVNDKPEKPPIMSCWDDYHFNIALCVWENKGIEPLKPEKVNCWDEFIFNLNTCTWENIGVQPEKPAMEYCWDDYLFNTTLCIWENQGTKPSEPEKLNCWDKFEFNKTTCAWDNTGTQPTEPASLNCWDEFAFDTNNCGWANIGVQQEKPEMVNCWDDFRFKETLCEWENIGTKPVKPPLLNSWDDFIFNAVSCTWENIGVTTTTEIHGFIDEVNLTCYPNPFRESVTIKYLLPESGLVNMEITGILGNKTKLLSNQFQSAGEHILDFDGDMLVTGIYQINLRLTSYNSVIWTKTIRTIKQ